MWDSKNQTNASRVERVKKQAARFCTSEYSRKEGETMTKILSQLDWKSLELRRKMLRITMLYKITNQLVNIKVDDHLKRNTRSRRGHKQKYTQIRYNTRRYGDTFPATTPDWNSLPEATVDAATINRFKGAIHNHKFCALRVHSLKTAKLVLLPTGDLPTNLSRSRSNIL